MEENSQGTGTPPLQVVGKCFAEQSKCSGLLAMWSVCTWAPPVSWLSGGYFGTTGDGALSRICIPRGNGGSTPGRPMGSLYGNYVPSLLKVWPPDQ